MTTENFLPLDGYRVAEIADQMVMSWKHNQRVEVKFRE